VKFVSQKLRLKNQNDRFLLERNCSKPPKVSQAYKQNKPIVKANMLISE
jgi:hypothetical protein